MRAIEGGPELTVLSFPASSSFPFPTPPRPPWSYSQPAHSTRHQNRFENDLILAAPPPDPQFPHLVCIIPPSLNSRDFGSSTLSRPSSVRPDCHLALSPTPTRLATRKQQTATDARPSFFPFPTSSPDSDVAPPLSRPRHAPLLRLVPDPATAFLALCPPTDNALSLVDFPPPLPRHLRRLGLLLCPDPSHLPRHVRPPSSPPRMGAAPCLRRLDNSPWIDSSEFWGRSLREQFGNREVGR